MCRGRQRRARTAGSHFPLKEPMPTNPKEPPKGKRLTIALVVFALVAVLLGTYVGGYFWLGRAVYWSNGGVSIARFYPQEWIARSYEPASRVEGWIRGAQVTVNW